MRHLILAASMFACGGAAFAQPLSTDKIVELYGQADQAWGAEVSPNGENVALGCAPMGPPAVCIYSLTGGGKPQLFQIPEKARLKTFYWISPNHMLVHVNIFDSLSTSSGIREYTFHRVMSHNVETGQSTVLLGREARSAIQGDLIVASLPDDDQKINMMLWYERSLWKVDLDKGDARHQESFGDYADDLHFYPNGEVAAIVTWNSKSGRYKLADAKRKTILESDGHDRYPYSIAGFSPDGEALLVWADTNEHFGLKQISLADGSIGDVEIDGQTVGNVGTIVDEITGRLLGVSYTNDLPQQVFIEPVLKSWHEELKGVFPGQNVVITSWTQDKSMMTVRAQSEGKPAQYYLFETNGPAVSPLAEAAPQLKGTVLGSVETVTYTAQDGLEIEGYLTLPSGKSRADGPFPLVLLPHGGPEARDTAAFDWWAQAYAAAGYAVLQPNFRGSAGYGQEFRNAGFGEFGGKMITDSLDGAAWAVEQGIAKEDGYCIVGGSYGGYAALQGAVLGGSDVKCAISVNGVTNPFSAVGDAPAGSDAFSYWEDYMGISRFANDEEKKTINPRERAGEIKAAVLLIHGREDTTVEYAQSRALADLIDNRPNFKFVSMKGEDHYLGSRDARQTVLKESLDWLATYMPVN